MSLVNRLAVGYGSPASWVHLPPFNLQFDAEPLLRSYGGYVPGRGSVNKGTKYYGYAIDIQFQARESTVAAGLALQETLRQAFVNSSGVGRTLDVAGWIDSGATSTRIYQNCQLVGGPTFYDRGVGQFAETPVVRVQLESHVYPYQTTDSAGGTGPSAGAYEDYLIDGGTATAMSPLEQRQSVSFYWDEQVKAWSSGSSNYFTAKVANDTGGTVEAYELEVTRARTGAGSSGNTTLTISTTAPGVGGGTQATIDLAYNARRVAAQTISVEFTNGGTLYAWCTDGTGMHSGVELVVRYK